MAELPLPLLAAACAVLLLGGCARPVGDFGRAEPSVLNDSVLPAVGTVRTVVAGEPISSFNKTDEETEMADRVWRFLTSGRTHDWFFDVATELHRTRILPGPNDPDGVYRYYRWLHSTRFQSAEVRYTTVSDDVEADLLTLPDTFAAICRVQQIDGQRAAALASLPGLDPGSPTRVAARKAENDDQIDWFVRALRYRYDSYNYALNQLLVETPHSEAQGVDNDLAELGQNVARAQAGRFCDETADAPGHRGPPAIPSRFSRATPRQPGPAGARALPARVGTTFCGSETRQIKALRGVSWPA